MRADHGMLSGRLVMLKLAMVWLGLSRLHHLCTVFVGGWVGFAAGVSD